MDQFKSYLQGCLAKITQDSEYIRMKKGEYFMEGKPLTFINWPMRRTEGEPCRVLSDFRHEESDNYKSFHDALKSAVIEQDQGDIRVNDEWVQGSVIHKDAIEKAWQAYKSISTDPNNIHSRVPKLECWDQWDKIEDSLEQLKPAVQKLDTSIWPGPTPWPSSSPLDQFELRDIVSLDISILNNLHLALTNIGLYLCIAAMLVLLFNLLASNFNEIASNKWSISLETVYATVYGIVISQINNNKGQAYFPLIYSLFTFILVNNLIGMVPYSFANTSHFVLTFFISFSVVLGATILSLQGHGLKFFSLFVPGGCPLGLLPLLVLIEFISYLARNISLGLRLAANILSGHMLLNILSGFAYKIMNSGIIYFFVGIIPLIFIIAFSGLELGIAFIQAQVFVVLTSSYIKDALDLH